jgi:putative heme-binding domain-containing protein
MVPEASIWLSSVVGLGLALASPQVKAQESAERDALIVETIQKREGFDYGGASEKVKAAVGRWLVAQMGTSEYFMVVERFGIRTERDALVKLVKEKGHETAGGRALKVLLPWGEGAALLAAVTPEDTGLLSTLGTTGAKEAIELLRGVGVDSTKPLGVREAAIAALGKSRGGELALLLMAERPDFPAELKAAAARVLSATTDDATRTAAARVLPMSAAAPAGSAHAPIAELVKKTGDPEAGKGVFLAVCSSCHQIQDQGLAFGPALSEIGSKLPKEALYQAILEPSQGISFGFEGWEIVTGDDTVVSGLISSQTDMELTVKSMGGIETQIVKATMKKRTALPVSLMPPIGAALPEAMLIDLVEFLSVQRKK